MVGRSVSNEKFRKSQWDGSIMDGSIIDGKSQEIKMVGFQKSLWILQSLWCTFGHLLQIRMLFVEEDRGVISSLTQQHLWMRTSRMFPWPKIARFPWGKIHEENCCGRWVVGDGRCSLLSNLVFFGKVGMFQMTPLPSFTPFFAVVEWNSFTQYVHTTGYATFGSVCLSILLNT